MLDSPNPEHHKLAHWKPDTEKADSSQAPEETMPQEHDPAVQSLIQKLSLSASSPSAPPSPSVPPGVERKRQSQLQRQSLRPPQ